MGRTCPFVSLRRWDFIDDILIGCRSSSLSISSHYMGLVEMDGDLFCMDYLGFHSDGVVVTLSFSKQCPWEDHLELVLPNGVESSGASGLSSVPLHSYIARVHQRLQGRERVNLAKNRGECDCYYSYPLYLTQLTSIALRSKKAWVLKLFQLQQTVTTPSNFEIWDLEFSVVE